MSGCEEVCGGRRSRGAGGTGERERDAQTAEAEGDGERRGGCGVRAKAAGGGLVAWLVDRDECGLARVDVAEIRGGDKCGLSERLGIVQKAGLA